MKTRAVAVVFVVLLCIEVFLVPEADAWRRRRSGNMKKDATLHSKVVAEDLNVVPEAPLKEQFVDAAREERDNAK